MFQIGFSVSQKKLRKNLYLSSGFRSCLEQGLIQKYEYLIEYVGCLVDVSGILVTK